DDLHLDDLFCEGRNLLLGRLLGGLFGWDDGPKANRPVVAAAGQRPAIGREGHAPHRAVVAFEGNSRLFLRQVPEGDAPNHVSGCQRLAVRGEDQPRNMTTAFGLQLVLELPGLHVPHPDHLVIRPRRSPRPYRGYGLSVRRKADGIGHRPGCGYLLAVRRKGDGTHWGQTGPLVLYFPRRDFPDNHLALVRGVSHV